MQAIKGMDELVARYLRLDSWLFRAIVKCRLNDNHSSHTFLPVNLRPFKGWDSARGQGASASSQQNGQHGKGFQSRSECHRSRDKFPHFHVCPQIPRLRPSAFLDAFAFFFLLEGVSVRWFVRPSVRQSAVTHELKFKIQLSPAIPEVKGPTNFICYWRIFVIANIES